MHYRIYLVKREDDILFSVMQKKHLLKKIITKQNDKSNIN